MFIVVSIPAAYPCLLLGRAFRPSTPRPDRFALLFPFRFSARRVFPNSNAAAAGTTFEHRDSRIPFDGLAARW